MITGENLTFLGNIIKTTGVIKLLAVESVWKYCTLNHFECDYAPISYTAYGNNMRLQLKAS